MPTYAYRCKSCGHEYEKFQKITDTTKAKCPKCGKRGERMISGGAGVVFKGSGFYETDYKRAGEAAKKSKSSESDAPKEKSTPSTSSESKKKDTGKGGDS